jgi:hypothetical protein
MTDMPEQSNSKTVLTIGNSGQIIAIAVAIIYFCGFVTVTAYLGSLGIKEYEAFRTQYMISGTTLLILMGLYYYLVGRHVASINEDTNNVRDILVRIGATGGYWELYAQIFPLLELCFFIVVSTFVCSSLLFTMSSRALISMIIPLAMGLFFIQSTIINKDSKDASKAFLLLIGIYYLAVVLAFWYLADG